MNKGIVEYTLCLMFDVTQHLWTMVVLSWGRRRRKKRRRRRKRREKRGKRTKEKRGRRKEKIHVEEG